MGGGANKLSFANFSKRKRHKHTLSLSLSLSVSLSLFEAFTVQFSNREIKFTNSFSHCNIFCCCFKHQTDTTIKFQRYIVIHSFFKIAVICYLLVVLFSTEIFFGISVLHYTENLPSKLNYQFRFPHSDTMCPRFNTM